MTVILVLMTFATFAMIDFFLSRSKNPRLALAKAHNPAVTPSEPSLAYVDGFAIPDRMRYHSGHSWALTERKQIHRIGIDEFAACLAGTIDKIELPKPGQWLRQGQKAWSLQRSGAQAEMVSPVEGEVLQINEEVLHNPALLSSDPYGKGWLMTVHVPDEENTFRNLLPSRMVPLWMRNAAESLYAMQPQLAGITAADGGRPSADLADSMANEDWEKMTREFFLTR